MLFFFFGTLWKHNFFYIVLVYKDQILFELFEKNN